MSNEQFSHFIQRVKERYNLDLNLLDLKQIAEDIYSGKAKLIRAFSIGFQYKVRIKGKLVIVVINRSHSGFVTALPMSKSKEKVTFGGKTYSYLDALYCNWLFKKFCTKNLKHKTCCPECGSGNVLVELGKGRLRCSTCNFLFKIPKLEQPIVKIDTVDTGAFKEVYDLSEDLWWYLYKTENELVISQDVIIRPVLVSNDIFRYYNSYTGKEIDLGYYTLEQLKEEA